MAQKTSTIAVINNNKVLVLRRGITAPWMPSRYCLPGGHVDNNESLETAALRELYEETGLNIDRSVVSSIVVNYHNYSKTVFVGKIEHPVVELNWEHDHYDWIKYSNANNYKLVPGLSFTLNTLYYEGYLND